MCIAPRIKCATTQIYFWHEPSGVFAIIIIAFSHNTLHGFR